MTQTSSTGIAGRRLEKNSHAGSVLRPVLDAMISVQIQLADARFVHRMGLEPTPINRLLKYPALGADRLSKRFKGQREDLLLERFSRLHTLHYGPTGRGYETIADQTAEERDRRYAQQQSRLEFFATSFSSLIDYCDGDTFADLGCGTGQNIRFLQSNFPSSRIVASDLSTDAVSFVADCANSSQLELSVGDIRDLAFVNQVLATPVDHIVLSHVFSLIFADSRVATHALRQALVDRMVASCRKSIVILDSVGSRGELAVEIEQKQRAFVVDDVLAYFADVGQGRAVLAKSDRTEAVIYLKSSFSGSLAR